MEKFNLNFVGILLLLVINSGNLFGVTNGTGDGTYDFGTLGADNSGGTGYKTAGDKFVVSNSFDVFGGALYLDNVATATVEFKAEGGSTMKQATLQNMVIGMAGGVTTINQFDISLKNASGATIETHTLSGDHLIDMVDGDVSISTLALSPAWPVAGYDNVAEISITYTLSFSTPNFEFRSITLANISNIAVSNNAPTATSFTAGTIYQGTAYAFVTPNFSYTDSDGDALDNIKIETVPANGLLWVDSDNSNIINGSESAIINGGTITKANLDAGYLKYLNTNGTSSSFTFSVHDGTEYSSSSYTSTLTVIPFPTVNFTAVSQLSTNETGTMTITAQLSASTDKTVTIPFTVNGSSTATGSGTDYTITASPLSITAGNSTATITVTIATDEVDEDNETVIVDMGTPTNATRGTATTHTATITDDDNAPSVSFSAASQSSTSETGTMTITAALSAASGKNVTVPFTVNGSSTATGSGTDYSITASPLIISAGASSASITITIVADALDEGNETVVVDMGTPTNATQGATTKHTVTITDNDNTPVVTVLQSFTIDEHSTGIIGTVAASDGDIGTSFQSWTITSNTNGDGDGNNAFAINPSTGQLSVNDADDLDRESVNKLTISVTVSDGANTSSEENVTINLNDVNDVLPVITASQMFSVPDNKAAGEPIDTVRATDGDITSTSFQNWTIVTNVNPDLDGNNAFSIDASTGAIKVNDIDDLISGNSHNLGITVSDGVNTSIETTIVINVIASNADPVITSTTTPDADENTTAVLTVTATDGDGDNVIFSITGGADKDLFDITTGGVLTFKAAKDFENAGDSDKNNKYLVEVTADDQKSGVDMASLVVNLVDVNEVPIVQNQKFSIQENSAVNTSIGTIVANDPENSSLTYTIKGQNGSDALNVNVNTGEIIIKDSSLIDYELNDTIKFEIEVADASLMSSAEITIVLGNINDNAPQLGKTVYDIDENPEKGAIVGKLEITDADGGITSSFIVDVLKGNEDTVFAYDPVKMEISVNKPEMIDYESTKSFLIDIRVSDGELSIEKTITINVNDVDDETTISEPETENISVYPNPVSDILIIESIDLLSLQLIDGSGKVVLESETKTYDNHFDVCNFKEGLYFLIMKSDKGTVSTKVVIER